MSQDASPRTHAPAKSNPWLVFVLLGVMFAIITGAMLIPGAWDQLVTVPVSNTRGGRLWEAIQSLGFAPTVAITATISLACIVGGLIARRRGRASH
ncbi:MAG: hypothetical protein LWW77_02985 [Propionibacteriales bacterium]|nr:hypothetical protein [Propionibacteriales bacterium]